MEKKKVLFITRKFPPQTGGMENLCFHIAENLPDNEFEVKVIALGKKQIHLLWFFPYVLFYIFRYARLYDYLLIGDGLMCMCGNACRWCAPFTKRLIILHGLDLTYRNPVYQLYLRIYLKRSSDLFVCNSKNTQRLTENWKLKNTIVITPGIDMDIFLSRASNKMEFRKKYNIPDNHLILLTVGRLVKRKGVAWFVKNVMPGLDEVTYIIIGEGEEHEKIAWEINRHQLEDKVLLLGRTSHKDWKECYQHADVFIMPNIYVKNDVEGFGIVAAEASLAGLVVVASNIDGIPDAIQHGKNGILVEGGNAEEYVKVIKHIQENLKEYKQLAQGYSAYTRKNYSWKKICEMYRDVMKKM